MESATVAIWSERSTSLLFRTIVFIALVVPSSALSCILESIDELNVFLGEDRAKVVITDIDNIDPYLQQQPYRRQTRHPSMSFVQVSNSPYILVRREVH